jgi:hypothetical protein
MMGRGEARNLISKGCKGIIFIIALILHLSSHFIVQVGASIHEYQNEPFSRRSNSFFFHGGSEGLYASRVHHNSSPQDKPLIGNSFIR